MIEMRANHDKFILQVWAHCLASTPARFFGNAPVERFFQPVFARMGEAQREVRQCV